VREFPPLDTAILEPDLHLDLVQTKLASKIAPLLSHDVLLLLEFALKTLQLAWREDCSSALAEAWWIIVSSVVEVAREFQIQ